MRILIKIIPRLYSPLWDGITSTCAQKEVKDHLVFLGVEYGQHVEFPSYDWLSLLWISEREVDIWFIGLGRIAIGIVITKSQYPVMLQFVNKLRKFLCDCFIAWNPQLY